MFIKQIKVLAVAIIAVLVLKGIELASNGVFDLGIPSSAVAQDAPAGEGEMMEADGKAGDTMAETSEPVVPPKEVDLGAAPDNDELLESERTVLERLSERRREIETREEGLALRERLLEAAEQRIETRLAELKAIEERLQQQAEQEKDQKRATLEGIVTMYENMKPKDAAKIFNTLELSVLLEVVENMKPRSMSSVLAAMTAESAQRLTLALARRAKEEEAADPLDTLESITQGG